MATSDSVYSTWTPRVLSVMRIIVAFLFMAHGAQKLFGFLAPPGASGPALLSQIGIGGVLEFFGGGLLLIGLFTRPVAFILSGMMAIGYFQMHAPGGFWPLQNKGELAVLYCFVFLFMSVAGGGQWSLDRLWRRDTTPLKADNYASA
ncbi:MAG: putative oxidoreductase [Blastocatellia bacterium]|jgi:putative oxidoreductase|nr:putative oxidoreductase [Blastocatellia bacterium]